MRASKHQLKDIQVKIRFEGGKLYDKTGTIDFVDNQIDKNSGSIALRGLFESPKGWLVPGDYLKVELVAPEKVTYMTVPQACTKGDAMSGYYVWTVKEDKAVRKDIKVSDSIDNNWVVESGLNKDDVVVVAGVQSISAEGQKLKIIDNEEYIKKLNAGK